MDPERYRQLEKYDRRTVQKWVAVVFVAAAFFSGLGWTVINTNELLRVHSSEINAIHAQTTKLTKVSAERALEDAEITRLDEQIKADSEKIAAFAAQLQNEITANHDNSSATLRSLCAAVPGCVDSP
jgi:hypothetical protein